MTAMDGTAHGSRFLDFDLRIESEDGAYQARVIDSPAGQASHVFTLPFSPVELENFVLKVGRTRRGVRRLDSPEMHAAREFGTSLYRAVFDADIHATFLRALDEADRQGLGLRVRLRLGDAAELVNVPWEYLYAPDLRRFVVLSNDTPIVRYLDLPLRTERLPVDPPLRVLVMISNPTDHARLEVEQEWRQLNEAVTDLHQRGLIELVRSPEATLSSLQSALRLDTYHVFHFIGHGGFDPNTEEGMLLLEDEAQRGQAVSGQHLGTILHDHDSLRLVVLNSCEGARAEAADPFAGAAQTLVEQGIPAVTAMQFEITDVASLTFSHEFYAAVADGYPIDAALAEARKAIFSGGNDTEWGTPVLYMRSPDGVIFDVDTAAARPPEAPEPTAPEPEPPEPAAPEPEAAAPARTAPLEPEVPTTPVPTAPPPAPSRRGLWWKPLAGLAAAIAAVVALFFMLQPGTPVVPDVVGMERTEAEAVLTEAGIGYTVTEEESQVAAGTVIAQAPGPGVEADEVELTVAVPIIEPPVPTVPDLIGEEIGAAESMLRELGIAFSTEEVAAGAATGTVVAQDPAAGAQAESVTLQVSTGAPDVVGLDLADATDILQAAGMAGDTTFVEDAATAGTVLEQDPAPGGTAATMALVVSSGPPALPEMPDIVGLSRGEALALLEAAGISVAVQTPVEDIGEPDVVLDQEPAPGSETESGEFAFSVLPEWATDCIPFDPNSLEIVDEGASGWLLQSSTSRMKLLDNQDDALKALAVAQEHTMRCFLGRGNDREDRSRYIHSWFLGDSGMSTEFPGTEDCIGYDPATLQIVDEGATGWLLQSSVSRMLLLDNQADAEAALAAAQMYTEHCFIGRGNDRENRIDYILEYWK